MSGFLRLLHESAGVRPRGDRRKVAAAKKPARRPEPDPTPVELVEEAPIDPALPRPRDPMPPPKPDAVETLPLFRVRIKQVDGPRTRWLEIRAQSVQDCELWIRRNLEGDWEIIELAGIEKTEPS